MRRYIGPWTKPATLLNGLAKKIRISFAVVERGCQNAKDNKGKPKSTLLSP